uniref:Putative ovule protein n=1 Tax=Solanum chacoense TaxID=4108 RepID=A0A0V0GLM6_SOLCH
MDITVPHRSWHKFYSRMDQSQQHNQFMHKVMDKERSLLSSSFFQRKGKAQRVFKSGSHTHRESNKRDHSASLVGIADQLSDLPFGVVHRRIAPTFSIVVLWVIGRHGNDSQNFSAMRRSLPFSVDLILSVMAQHT